MNSDAAIAKIKMMKRSLRCFVFGIVSLLPVLGFPFGVCALATSRQVRAGQRQFWNPARPYWIWGLVLAALGTLLSLLVVTLILCSGEMLEKIMDGLLDADVLTTMAPLLIGMATVLTCMATLLTFAACRWKTARSHRPSYWISVWTALAAMIITVTTFCLLGREYLALYDPWAIIVLLFYLCLCAFLGLVPDAVVIFFYRRIKKQ